MLVRMHIEYQQKQQREREREIASDLFTAFLCVRSCLLLVDGARRLAVGDSDVNPVGLQDPGDLLRTFARRSHAGGRIAMRRQKRSPRT